MAYNKWTEDVWQRAIDLYENTDMSFGQIARELDIPPYTVGKNMRARGYEAKCKRGHRKLEGLKSTDYGRDPSIKDPDAYWSRVMGREA